MDRLDRVQILVVDDHEDTLEMLHHVFTQLGAVVETATNAQDAFAWLEHKRADVIVSDLSMPRMDGLELMRRVRALPAQTHHPTPAIALTGFARDEDRKRAEAVGFQALIAKPIDPFRVVEEVVRLLGISGRS